MSLIEKLTPGQEALLPQFKQEWFNWGINTDPADRAKAEAAILAMRKEVGVTHAPTFIWCESPATSLLAVRFLKSEEFKRWCAATQKGIKDDLGSSLELSLHSSLWSSLRSSLESSLRSSLHSSLRSSLESSLGSSLGSSLESSLGSSLESSLGSSLHSSLRSSLWSSLESSLRSSLWSSLESSLRSSLHSSLRSSLESSLGEATQAIGDEWWGQHESHWISFYVFCRDVLGVQYEQEKSTHLDVWRDLAQSCCWWWCYENYVIISERPRTVRMQSFGHEPVLHADDGPALAFRDGYSVYAFQGVRVPEQVIMAPESITKQDILEESNAEVKRVMIQRIGPERLEELLQPVILDESEWGNPKQRYRLLRVENGQVPFIGVDVTCSTKGERYLLSVPERNELLGNKPMKTALEAVAWTFQMKPEEYMPLIET